MQGINSPFLNAVFGGGPFKSTTVEGVTYHESTLWGSYISADPDYETQNPAGDILMYFTDADGTGDRTRIKRAVADTIAGPFGAATTVYDLSGNAVDAVNAAETPAVHYKDGVYWMYPLTYIHADGSSTAAATIDVLYSVDGISWVYAGVLFGAGSQGTYDDLFVLEPCALNIPSVTPAQTTTHVVYVGAHAGTGYSLIHCSDAGSDDGYSMTGLAPIFIGVTDVPAGATYAGLTSPYLLEHPDGGFIMAATGNKGDLSNDGGITLCRTEASTPASGWSFGKNYVWTPQGDETIITGSALYYEASTGLLHNRYTAVGPISGWKTGYASVPLESALILAGL